MVSIHKTFNAMIALITIILFVFSSCSLNDPYLATNEEDSQVWHSATLYFNPISSSLISRALSETPSYEPSDNDLLAISFYKSGEQAVKGYARYNMSERRWDLTYLGDLICCNNMKCEIKYIGNNPMFDNVQKAVSFSAQSSLFECNNATYDFNGGNAVNLYATLSPITSRVRFKGNKESEFEMKGFGTYNKLSFSDWQFDQVYCLDAILCNLKSFSDGYISPYYYVYSQKSDGLYKFTICDNLWIKDGNSVYLWKKETSKYLENGVSGLINLPSIDNDGWINDTFRTKSISDITLPYEYDGVWTQTQTKTRFYSNVGIQINLTYTITNMDSQNFTNHPFCIGCWAYDNNGNFLNSRQSYIHKDHITVNKSVDYNNEFYVKGASYYEIQFYGLKLNAKITNFRISTF